MKDQSSASLSRRSSSQLNAFLGIKRAPKKTGRPVIGVIEGCGIGPEVVGAALRVLSAVEQVSGLRFELRHGGPVGEEAEKRFGTPLPASTVRFFKSIFASGGAILNGAGGGRFVYDLREQFDLFCKFAPIKPCPELSRATQVSTDNLSKLDMLIVRDNSGGVYQGKWKTRNTPKGKVAEHQFTYSASQIKRLAVVAARAAKARSGKMHVIIKDGGVPAISALWREVSASVATKHGVDAVFMNIDLAAYEFVRNPLQFDVVFTPNLFGDILVDITGALLASRGVTFSGNFDEEGHGVYQTNHGCAHDLAGADVANPGGQILSLAMMLRESFGLGNAATLIEKALAKAWGEGWRTVDVAEPGCRVLGTHAMAEQVAQQIFRLAEVKTSDEACAVAS